MNLSDTPTPLIVEDWGLLKYEQSFERQNRLLLELQAGQRPDTLVMVEHPAVVTLGRRGSVEDLKIPQSEFNSSGVELKNINRGGLATAHEPGQFVAYPIVVLKKKDLRWYADSLLKVVVAVLHEYGLEGVLKKGEPGVWVNGGKICSFGIAVKKWCSMHGIALNVNNDLKTFGLIVPCGRPQETVTSIVRELGSPVDMDELKQYFVSKFCTTFSYQPKA
ncbi:lipoyl(octanoyl) transferase LipB [Malonomonas rubra]|uniref:lipoyl(octanoyl) transferase LipB n=1 Tax=Malonomonas rubra TaxID=57040 RepID=UPI0026ECF714|nr:lipoyl(octanoyl) transferase LipB [Malonomonas rubra]